MSKVKEMSLKDAKAALVKADAALQSAAVALAKLDAKADKAPAIKALRAAAIEFTTFERYARSAQRREATNTLLD